MNEHSPTTASLQTPPGRGGIAVIALRGPAADGILAAVFRPVASAASADGRLRLGHVADSCGVIDQAVVARRGDLAEINIHGGPAAVAAVLRRLGELGATVVSNSRAAAECFVSAHPRWNNPAIGRELIELLPGVASEKVAAALSHQWSAGLSELAASVLDSGCNSGAELRAAASRLRTIRRVLSPAEVVLAGPPNAGKSTLANALLGRAASIVHDRAGTTRDWVRELALLRGLPVWLTDTAGLWHAEHELDAEAVRRSGLRIASADLVLLLGSGRIEPLPDWLGAAAPGRPTVRVATKSDIAPPPPDADLAVCAPAGLGLDELARRILDCLNLGDFDPCLPAAFTDRQHDLLLASADAFDAGQAASAQDALRELLG